LIWEDASFDVVTQFTVFSSILDPDLKEQVAQEMIRVTKPGGYILWFDFFVNNPFNHDVRGIGKREIRGLVSGLPHRIPAFNLRRATGPKVTGLLPPDVGDESFCHPLPGIHRGSIEENEQSQVPKVSADASPDEIPNLQ